MKAMEVQHQCLFSVVSIIVLPHQDIHFSNEYLLVKKWKLNQAPSYDGKKIFAYFGLQKKPTMLNKIIDYVTHSLPMHPFSAPWKHQKTLRFCSVFWG